MSYFTPQPFEKIKGRSIYHYLGVRFFERYLLVTDLVMFRFHRRKQFGRKKAELRNELLRLEWQTKRDETIHWSLMLILFLGAGLQAEHLSSTQWWLVIFLNIYVNVYPIFVQRHNRMRIVRLLNKL